MSDSPAYTRYTEALLLEALADSPVVLIHGSRQSGKTTLACMVGDKEGYDYLSFDDDARREAAQTDPIGFVQSLPDKIILDEVQRVPGLFTALKAAVDRDRTPGRFMLTGSANVLLLPTLADSLAGRMSLIQLRPLSRAEVAGQKPDFLSRLFSADFGTRKAVGYQRLGENLATLVCDGGYPAALARPSEKRRQQWYRDFITTLIQRDVQDIARIHNLDILPRLLTVAAGQTARLFIASELASPFSLTRPTIQQYLALLEQLFLIEQLQPWHTNRLSRLVKTPKLHITDTGLACALLGINATALNADRKLLGQLLETFVYLELRKQADWHDQALNFYHFRNKDKVEVDIIIEQGRQLAGIEIKASATVTKDDFKALNKLKEACGKAFAAGVVFYDGEQVLLFGERLFAVPLAVLASPAVKSTRKSATS